MELSFLVLLLPFGEDAKCIVLPTILKSPLYNLIPALLLCVVGAVPTNPLSTSIRFADPVLVIGPRAVVPKPTEVTCMYSSPILITSSVVIVAIPATSNIVLDVDIDAPLFVKVVVTGVNANGAWTILSILNNVFSDFLLISNSWALPPPVLGKVTPVPELAFDSVNASLKVSLVNLIAYTSVGKLVEVACCIWVPATPMKVEFGVYTNSSPVAKKWSSIVNIPVTGSNIDVSDGLNIFSKIGTLLCFNGKSFLLILSPFNALNLNKDNPSRTVPYESSGAVFKSSFIV